MTSFRRRAVPARRPSCAACSTRRRNAKRGDPAAVLAAVADPGTVQRLFRRLYGVREEMLDAPNQRHDSAYAVQRQIVSLLRALPPDVTLGAILHQLNPEIDLVEVDAV